MTEVMRIQVKNRETGRIRFHNPMTQARRIQGRQHNAQTLGDRLQSYMKEYEDVKAYSELGDERHRKTLRKHSEN